MNEDYEELFRRHEISKPGRMSNPKKLSEEVGKALSLMEKEVADVRRYARSLDKQLGDYKSKLAEISRDDYGGLERILEKNEDDNKSYIIGLRSKNNYEFYLPKESPKYHEISNELDYVKEAHDQLNIRLEDAVKDNEKKKKERDRALSRAVSAEKKLDNFVAVQGFYIDGDCDKMPLPFKIEAEGRCVAEVRADHGKIMVCKNRNSSWFFRFGDVSVEDIDLSQTKTKGIQILPDELFKVMWSTEDEVHEECYIMRKLR
jgi:hypothetical protein